MSFFFSFLIFLFGLSVGSFLNVLIDRLPRGEQVISGRSYCDYCRKKLKIIDLIPLLSFILLGGRCRYCHKKISFYYPLVELITGLTFVLLWFYLPHTPYSILQTTILCSLIVIFFADLKYGIIPDEMIVVGILASLPLVFAELLNSNPVIPLARYPVFNHIIVGIITSALFLFLLLITRGRGMGLGDVKLSFLMGFFLGWPKIIVAIYLAFLTGAIIGVILILLRKKKFGQTIPFGPFLAVGTLIAMFFGGQIVKW